MVWISSSALRILTVNEGVEGEEVEDEAEAGVEDEAEAEAEEKVMVEGEEVTEEDVVEECAVVAEVSDLTSIDIELRSDN